MEKMVISFFVAVKPFRLLFTPTLITDQPIAETLYAITFVRARELLCTDNAKEREREREGWNGKMKRKNAINNNNSACQRIIIAKMYICDCVILNHQLTTVGAANEFILHRQSCVQ